MKRFSTWIKIGFLAALMAGISSCITALYGAPVDDDSPTPTPSDDDSAL